MAAIFTELGDLSRNHGFLTDFNFISGVSNARYIFHKKISLSELLKLALWGEEEDLVTV